MRDGKQLFEYLEKNHEFKLEDLDSLYDYAKFQYECGNYSGEFQEFENVKSIFSS